jgi:hypothetical protein
MCDLRGQSALPGWPGHLEVQLHETQDYERVPDDVRIDGSLASSPLKRYGRKRSCSSRNLHIPLTKFI